jgi:hypothetical protein
MNYNITRDNLSNLKTDVFYSKYIDKNIHSDIFDDAGNQEEKIDLTTYNLAGLHELVQSRGFRISNEEL